MENYNKYNETLDIDCCNKKITKTVKSSNNCCGGESLPSYNNEIEVLINQLKREVKKLMKNTEAKLLCQDKKIAETMVYIKNNLSNAIRNLLDSMLESGEIEDILKTIILDNVSTLQNEIDDLNDRVTVNTQDILINSNNIALNKSAINNINSVLINKADKQDKMVVIGDSWSIEDYPYISDISNMWQHLVAKQLNLVLKNYANSGAGFTVADNSFDSQVTESINDSSLNPNEVKYIFVFGGINDLDFGVPSNLKTACDSLINRLKVNYPKSQIILCGCNTQVKFKKGDSNTTYNTMDITTMLQQSAYENGVTFIDTMPFLYGITNTINPQEHPSLEGLKALANGILSCLNSTYTRVANDNGNASYTLTSETANAPGFIIQSSVKNNTLTLLFFISGITNSNTVRSYIYNIPELTLPYMNAEALKNLDDGKPHGYIKVTSNNSKLVRISIDANYSGSLYYQTTIQI